MMLGGSVLFLVIPSVANLQANTLLRTDHVFNFGITQLPFGKIKWAPSNNANMFHLNKHKSRTTLFKNELREI